MQPEPPRTSSGLVTLAAFEATALAFLEANAEPRPPSAHVFGEGSDDVSLFPDRTSAEEEREVSAARQWSRKVFDAGFGWITGPVGYGGRGLPSSYQTAWSRLEAGFVTPTRLPLMIGLQMVAPTLLAHGSETVKQRYLAALFRGEVVGCQLFSEPGHGSDLAGVETRAVRDGEEWVLDGQKLWTSGAHYSDIGEILCRTDPGAPKHRGLSAFVLDMAAPGVEVRPLRQMTGGSSFNEVFLTGVRVPADHLLGEPGGGWTVALTTLMSERGAIGGAAPGLEGGSAPGPTGALRRLVELMGHLGATEDPLLRDELADLIAHVEVANLTSRRAADRLRSGAPPGPELSTGKLALTENMRRTADLAAKVLGQRITADSGEWGTYAWSRYLLGVPGMRIGGGTDEILRNIIAERVLGLPREPPGKAEG